MLASGAAASRRSVSADGAQLAARRRDGRSLDSDTERSGVRDFDLAAHEAARYSSALARLQDCVESFLRRAGNRHEDGVRGQPADRPTDVVEPARDRDALDAAAAERRVIVDEADDALAVASRAARAAGSGRSVPRRR